MPWFKVDDSLHSSKKLLAIPRRHRLAAIGLWTIAGSWSADQLEDGIIPDYMVEEWGGTKTVVDCLVTAGLWERAGGAVKFRNWAEYQPTKADVERERTAARERMRNARAKRKGVNLEEQGDPGECSPEPEPNFDGTSGEVRESFANPDPVPVPVPFPVPVPTPFLSSDADASDPDEDDGAGANEEFPEHVYALCDYLAEQIKRNGNKVGKIGTRWHQAMDRLVRIDGYTPDQVRQVIDWSQQNEFWQGNILSASKLREKFDQLKHRMFTERNSPPTTGNRATDRMMAGYNAMASYQGPTEDPWARKELTP